MIRRVLFGVMIAAASGCSNDAPVEQPAPARHVQRPEHANSSRTAQQATPPTVQQPGSQPKAFGGRPPVFSNQAMESMAQIALRRKMSRLAEELQDAGAYVRGGIDDFDTIRRRLQPVREQLPLLDVSTETETPKWNKIRLNQLGKQFDAVRFRAHPAVQTDLYVSIAFTGSISKWEVIPVEGSQKKIAARATVWNVRVEALELPDDNTMIFMRIPGIPAAAENVLWLMRPDDAAWDVNIAVTFLPADSTRRSDNAASLAKSMGITYETPRFTADAQGAKDALQFAKSLMSRGGQNSGQFDSALQAVAPALPELAAGTEQGISWNRIVLNESGQGFDAFRFRCPLNSPSDLRYVIAAPRGREFDFGVVVPDGKVRGMNVKLEIDLQLASVELPQENVTFFKHLLNGRFQAGEEYVFWVRSGDGPSQPTALGLHFAPMGPEPNFTSSRQIAAAAQIALPETIEPSRVAAARRICCAWEGKEAGLLREALQSVASALPELNPSTGDSDLNWNTLELNADGIGFDAFRFKSPLSQPADFFCVFTNAQDLRWQMIPAEGFASRIFDIRRTRGIEYEGVDTPSGSETAFAALTDWQQGNAITPGREYILWFRSPEGAAPRKVQLAIRLVPDVSKQAYNSAYEIASRLGIVVRTESFTGGRTVLGRHKSRVVDQRFSPEGTMLLSLDRKGTLHLWNLETKQLLGTLDFKDARLASMLSLSHDGRLAAVGLDEPARVVVWDLRTRSQIAEIAVEGWWTKTVEFSPDGSQLAVFSTTPVGGGFQQHFEVRQVASGERVCSARVAGVSIQRIKWTNDGRLIGGGQAWVKRENMSSISVPVLRVWDPKTLKQTEERKEGNGSIQDLAISDSAGLLAVAGLPAVTKLWKLDELEELVPLTTFGSTGSVALSADGRLAAMGSQESVIQLWDLERRRPVSWRKAQGGAISRLQFAPDGNWLSALTNDSTVQVWDTRFPDSIAEVNSIGMKLIRIPAGSFEMGSPDLDQIGVQTKDNGPRLAIILHDSQRPPAAEMPRHTVVITHPFKMAMHEVTVGQFRQFVSETGYKTSAEQGRTGGGHIIDPNAGWQYRPEYNWRNPGFAQDDSHPVVQISWLDAEAFCRWLSAKEGAVYRLPTEAEWEYACRAGTTSTLNFEQHADLLPLVANIADLSILKHYTRYDNANRTWDDEFPFSSPVGSFCPNAFGLYDMYGNACEWCADWFDPQYYAQSPEQDPPGPSNGKNRVQRGASFLHGSRQTHSAAREFDKPDVAQSVGGFRVVQEIQ
jgi:formylglycine-generating enzyme